MLEVENSTVDLEMADGMTCAGVTSLLFTPFGRTSCGKHSLFTRLPGGEGYIVMKRHFVINKIRKVHKHGLQLYSARNSKYFCRGIYINYEYHNKRVLL